MVKRDGTDGTALKALVPGFQALRSPRRLQQVEIMVQKSQALLFHGVALVSPSTLCPSSKPHEDLCRKRRVDINSLIVFSPLYKEPRQILNKAHSIASHKIAKFAPLYFTDEETEAQRVSVTSTHTHLGSSGSRRWLKQPVCRILKPLPTPLSRFRCSETLA